MKINGSTRPANESHVVRFFTLLATVLLWAGCASSPAQYTSPRITGQVLNAQTRQPIKDVRIQRLHRSINQSPDDPPHGSEALQQNWYAYTDSEGRFDVDSVTTLTLFQSVSWYSVTLAFTREGYSPFTTNYTPAEATYTPKGEPVVNAGTILLRPLSP